MNINIINIYYSTFNRNTGSSMRKTCFKFICETNHNTYVFALIYIFSQMSYCDSDTSDTLVLLSVIDKTITSYSVYGIVDVPDSR